MVSRMEEQRMHAIAQAAMQGVIQQAQPQQQGVPLGDVVQMCLAHIITPHQAWNWIFLQQCPKPDEFKGPLDYLPPTEVAEDNQVQPPEVQEIAIRGVEPGESVLSATDTAATPASPVATDAVNGLKDVDAVTSAEIAEDSQVQDTPTANPVSTTSSDSTSEEAEDERTVGELLVDAVVAETPTEGSVSTDYAPTVAASDATEPVGA